ncbi:hypothetical protein ACVWW6_003731 [Bradyrhizobium sp. USDA 3311]
MDTSGTGHDRCPSQSFPTHEASGTPPLGGNGKIKKRSFGFKRGAKIFGPSRASRREVVVPATKVRRRAPPATPSEPTMVAAPALLNPLHVRTVDRVDDGVGHLLRRRLAADIGRQHAGRADALDGRHQP